VSCERGDGALRFVDEDPNHLSEALKLPRMHEHLRAQLERTLTPLVNPRARRPAVQA
jgi:glyoxalase family protein